MQLLQADAWIGYRRDAGRDMSSALYSTLEYAYCAHRTRPTRMQRERVECWQGNDKT